LGIQARVKKIAPKCIKNQESRAKSRCRKFFQSLSGKIVVLEDEAYFYLDPSDVPERKYYHSSDSEEVEYDQKL
jgi:hypothetical protein